MVNSLISCFGRCAIAVAFLGLVFVGPAQSESGVMAHDGWVMFAPPTFKVHAGYVTLHNHSDKKVVLKSVESPAYGKVELHESVIEDGVASMRSVEGVPIEPGKAVELKPGGLHMMLMMPKEKQVLGAKVPLVLKFEGGEEVALEAKVSKWQADGSHKDHSDHKDMHKHHH